MKKHKLVSSEIAIPNAEIIATRMSEGEVREQILYKLLNDVIHDIIRNEDFFEIVRVKRPRKDISYFKLSLAIMNPKDYKQMEEIVTRNNHQIPMENGEVISLSDIL